MAFHSLLQLWRYWAYVDAAEFLCFLLPSVKNLTKCLNLFRILVHDFTTVESLTDPAEIMF